MRHTSTGSCSGTTTCWQRWASMRPDGSTRVLCLREGPSENATVTTGLLEALVERGLQADRRRLFVIDGAKVLRSAIDHVFGRGNLVQRCRNHKVRNVVGHLPKTQHEQARSTLRAASLREGLAELFTVNRLGLPGGTAPVRAFVSTPDASAAGATERWRCGGRRRRSVRRRRTSGGSPATSISGC